MTKPKKKKLTARELKWRDQWAAESRKFHHDRKLKLLSQTTLEQRTIFIEKLREAELSHGHGFHLLNWVEAKEAAGIEDDTVAWTVYRKNSRPSKARHLVDPGKVR